jgi:hypothetical protein
MALLPPLPLPWRLPSTPLTRAWRLRRSACAAALALGLSTLSACERGPTPPAPAGPTPEASGQAPAASAAAASAPAALPAAVIAFREQRDQCDHFRGEEAADPQRAAFLAAALARTCTGTDAALAGLRQRYRQDPAALAALKDYEDRIE